MPGAHTRGDPGLWCQAGDRHGRDNWRTLFATLTAALPGAVAVVYMECPEWGMWMASVSLGGGGKVRPRGEWRRGSGVQRRLRGSRSSVQGAGRRAALPDGASRGRCLTGPAPHGPAGGATSRGGQGALSRAISRARQGVLPHGPAGGATSRARQGALPHGPGGRRPRLLRQLPFQLLEALLGGPFGPELPQATREVLVQQALQGQGDAGAAEAEAPQSPPNPSPGRAPPPA